MPSLNGDENVKVERGKFEKPKVEDKEDVILMEGINIKLKIINCFYI